MLRLWRFLLFLFWPMSALGSYADSAAEPSKTPAKSRPNVLIILADDLGFSDLGCYGGEIATPQLDRLAAGGLRYSQFYNTARCWPSRSALLTGYYPQQIHMDPPSRKPSPAWVRTLPQWLQPAGYRSYHSGKWHFFGRADPVRDAGFAKSAAVGHDNNYFEPAGFAANPVRKAANKEAANKTADGPPPRRPADFYSTTAITSHALDCLREHQRTHPGTPFLSYVAYYAPHFPVQAPAADIARVRGRYDVGWDVIRQRRYQRLRELGGFAHALPPREAEFTPRYWKPEFAERLGPNEVSHPVAWDRLTEPQQKFQAAKMEVHAAMVERLDAEVGRLVEHLRETGELDNTLILFLSDNGADATILVRGSGHDLSAPAGSAETFLCIGPGWATACNTPFHRHKIWVHEGGISSPLIVHWPKGIDARGQWRRDVCHIIDVLPTVLEAASVKPELPAGAPALPGQSLLASFARDGAASHDWLYFHHEGNRALRVGDWKIVSSREDGGTWRLHDLGRDRGEQHDLAAEQPNRLRELVTRWEALTEQFRRDAGPP